MRLSRGGAWWGGLTGILVLGAAVLHAQDAPVKTERPNVVFILADDLGYGDPACYGHPCAKTPALDRLAREGTRFRQFYVTGVTCCPSRTGFMTGRFPATFAKYPAGNGFGRRVTVTELLKRRGYATGHFGKWHIGPETAAGTYGIDTIDEQPGRRRDRNSGTQRRPEPAGRDAHIFDAAIRFIEQHRDEPFYVNVWGHVSHFPVNPPEAFVERFKELKVDERDFSPAMREKFAFCRQNGGDVDACMRRYLADVASLDDDVNRLLQRIDELGLRDNTIVVFSSDHGPAPITPPPKTAKLRPEQQRERLRQQLNMLGSPGALRGGKHGMYEGGVRVPLIVRWPGHVPAGRIDETSVIGGIDWLPTICHLAGATVPEADFDGENAADAWLGRKFERTRPLFWKRNNERSEIGIRDGKWKLLDPNGRRGGIELYDVVADPAEGNNLASKHPEVVERLRAKIKAWDATLPRQYEK